MYDIPDEYTYEYVDPRTEGATRRTLSRTFLHIVYEYRTPEENGRVRIEVAKHPSWLGKVLAVMLFPVSVLQAGVVEAWTSTVRYIWDRRYGSFTSSCYWQNARGEELR